KLSDHLECFDHASYRT
ncbi:hypothetical protein D043_3778B, partial [Vibrio parahaemolyticus EKP-021]